MQKKKVLKIIIPVCIAFVIAGLWMYKNTWNLPEQETQPFNEDFALEAGAIDLEALTAHGLPIIIDFGADWCSPCREFAPVLETMNEEMQGRAIIKYVDIDKNSDIAANFPVQVIPTQVFILPDGKPYVPNEDISAEFIQYNDTVTAEHIFTVHQGGLSEEQMRAILTDMGAGE